MSYPYAPGLGNYKQYEKTLPDLAATSDKRQIGRFCSGLSQIKAYALDKLKKPLKTQRGSLYRFIGVFSGEPVSCRLRNSDPCGSRYRFAEYA